MTKYAIIENDIVKQIQCDDDYELSSSEILLEVGDEVIVGMGYKDGKFVHIPRIKTEKELAEEIRKQKEADIIASLGAKDKTDAIVKQLNMLSQSLVGGGATEELKASFAKVQEILSK
jgi:epoxyqueuosine reductase QueG